MSEPVTCEIFPDYILGKVLTHLAEQAQTIVEVGTYHGTGSTKCLATGLIKPTQKLWTIDKNPLCVEEAKKNLTDARITFLTGRTLELLEHLPAEISLLYLDGGEDDSLKEFETLSPRAAVVALDDTMGDKNREARLRCLASPAVWKVLLDLPLCRTGIAAFERVLP